MFTSYSIENDKAWNDVHKAEEMGCYFNDFTARLALKFLSEEYPEKDELTWTDIMEGVGYAADKTNHECC